MTPLYRLGDIEKGPATVFETVPMTQWTMKAIEQSIHLSIAALVELVNTPGAPD